MGARLIPFMVRQVHHERNQALPFALSLSKGDPDLIEEPAQPFAGAN